MTCPIWRSHARSRIRITDETGIARFVDDSDQVDALTQAQIAGAFKVCQQVCGHAIWFISQRAWRQMRRHRKRAARYRRGREKVRPRHR